MKNHKLIFFMNRQIKHVRKRMNYFIKNNLIERLRVCDIPFYNSLIRNISIAGDPFPHSVVGSSVSQLQHYLYFSNAGHFLANFFFDFLHLDGTAEHIFFLLFSLFLWGIKPDRKRIYVVTFIQHKCNIKTKAIYVCIWNKRIKKIVKKKPWKE